MLRNQQDNKFNEKAGQHFHLPTTTLYRTKRKRLRSADTLLKIPSKVLANLYHLAVVFTWWFHLFFWLGANSNGKLYGPRTHIYAPKRDGSWQQINFTPPSAWLLLQHPRAAPWYPAPFSHLPTAAFIARRFSVSVSSRLRCGIIRKMSLLVWILRNSNGGKGKMEQKTGAVGNTLRENMWKVLTGILPLFKNISLRMFAIIFWIPLGL